MYIPRIVMADTDEAYLKSVQTSLLNHLDVCVSLEIITEELYWRQLLDEPQQIDVLILSEKLYSDSLHYHEIGIMVTLTEQESFITGGYRIFKYGHPDAIVQTILRMSHHALHREGEGEQETKVVLICSADWGTGKTTISAGISACLSQKNKRVLYVNVAWGTRTCSMISNTTFVSASSIYSILMNPTDHIYDQIKHLVCREIFYYLPPFEESLPTWNLKYDLYEKIVASAKASREYDYIIVDIDHIFLDEQFRLLAMADRIVLVEEATAQSNYSMKRMFENNVALPMRQCCLVVNKCEEDTFLQFIHTEVARKMETKAFFSYQEQNSSMNVEWLAQCHEMKKITAMIL